MRDSSRVRGAPQLQRPAESALASIMLVALAVGLLGLSFVVYHLFDFHVFWQAGRDVLAGTTPYPAIEQINAHARDYYVYPPPVALAATPFALLPYPVAGAAISIVLVGSLVAALRILGVRDWRCYALAFLSVPTLQAVGTGTIAPLLVLGLAALWRFRDRRVAAALLVAAVVTAKLFLWPLVLWLVASRRLASALGSVVAGCAIAAVSWAAIGFAGLGDYPELLRRLVDVEGPRSFSLATFARSLGLSNGASRPALVAVYAFALLAIVWLARRPEGDRRSFVAAIAAALLLSPIVWLHYFSLLIVPLAMVVPEAGPLWLVPVLAFLPFADSAGVAWRIAWVLAVFAAVVGATIGIGPGRRQAVEASPS